MGDYARFGRLGRLAAGGAIAAVLVYLGIVLRQCLIDRDVAPFWDMMGVEHFLNHWFLAHYSPLTALAFYDNQHKPVFPLYLSAIDHVFFASRGIFLLICSWAALAGVCAISLHRLLPAIEKPAVRLGYLLLFPCVIFWPAGYDNLVWPKQLHVCLQLLCACAAFSLLTSLDCRQALRPWQFLWRHVLLLLLVIVATFSFGWGLVASFVVGGFALLRWPFRRSIPLLLTVAACATVYVYALVWRTPAALVTHYPSDPAVIARGVVHYLLALFGAPLWWLMEAPFRPPGTALLITEAAGICGLALALWALWRMRWRIRTADANASEPVAAARTYAQIMLLFTFAAIVVTMSGRFLHGPAQAVTSRYLILPSLFWLVLPFQDYGVKIRIPRTCIMAAIAVAIALTTPANFSFMADRAALIRLGAIAAVMGEADVPIPPRLYPDAETPAAVFKVYAAKGTSVYADPWPHWLGMPANAIAPGDTSECEGAVDLSQPVAQSSDERVDGWLFNPSADRRAWIALAGRDGRVIGLATTGFPGPAPDQSGQVAKELPADIAFYLRRDHIQRFLRPDGLARERPGTSARTGFVGYLQGRADDVVAIYAWFGGSDWCRATLGQ